MLKISVSLNDKNFQRKIRKFPSDIKPTLQEAVKRDAKFFIKEIIKVTPPFSQSARGSAAAKKAGEKKVDRDIRRVYASASYAYGTIKNPAAASGFWFSVKGRGKNKNLQLAHSILLANSSNVKIKNAEVVSKLNESFHRLAKKNGTVPHVDVKQVIANESSLSGYIKAVKKRVGALAGGWAAAAEKLGVSVPAWVKRHKGNGSITRFLRAGNPHVVLKNDASYATNADMSRRINFVLGMTKRQRATEIFIRQDLLARWRREFNS